MAGVNTDELMAALDPLMGYAHRLCGQRDEAEDLVQAAYERFLKSGKSQKGQAVRPLLFRIVHNLFIDEMRSRNRRPRVISIEDAGAQTNPALAQQAEATRHANDSLSDETLAALESLPPEYREVLWLREVEEFSYEELAEILEVPIGTVRSRLSRARRTMLNTLRREKIGHENREVKS